MIANGKTLVDYRPVEPFIEEKVRFKGVSYGLAEAGYDIRIKQAISFYPTGAVFETAGLGAVYKARDTIYSDNEERHGHFVIASTVEEFKMPPNLVGIVHDKSTWARKGLSVFNTVIEPGWKGFLTLELVYHGKEVLHIPAGVGIAQVIFSEVLHPASYDGKYQNQADKPVEGILE